MHDDGSRDVYGGDTGDFSLSANHTVLDRRLDHTVAKKEQLPGRRVHLRVSGELMFQLSVVGIGADSIQVRDLDLVRLSAFPEGQQPSVMTDESGVRRVLYHGKALESVSYHSH